MPSGPADPGTERVVARLRAAGSVFAEDEARLLLLVARSPGELAALVERRAAGLPLEHVVGWASFCGLRIQVEPGVFVPRRRTEFLARQAASAAARAQPPAVVVDLCCGAGTVAAALAATVAAVAVHAVDIDPAAVRCARRNLPGGQVYEGDLYRPLPAALRGRVDVLVANAPYVPTAAIGLLPAEARLHEPRVALDGGQDGLELLRRVVAGAPGWLAPAGTLLVELTEQQAPLLAEAAARSGLAPQVISNETLGATVLMGRRSAAGRGQDPAFDGRGDRGRPVVDTELAEDA